MTKISYLNIPVGFEKDYFNNLKQADRFNFSRVVSNKKHVSRTKKNKLKQKTLMFLISDIWKSFNSSTIDNWNNIASSLGLSGYQLFMKDQSLRIKAGLSGSAVPSFFHQCNVGCISVSSSSSSFKITQKHPHNYWILTKTFNKKSMLDPLYISEDFVLPLTLGLSYSSDFDVAGPDPFARFFATVRSSYQGVDRFTDFVIDLDFSSDWQNIEKVFSSVEGYVVSYDVSFEINDLIGSLYFDNLKIFHSSQNWARDSSCYDISKKHTFPFHKVINNWEGIAIPDGSLYHSIYKDF